MITHKNSILVFEEKVDSNFSSKTLGKITLPKV